MADPTPPHDADAHAADGVVADRVPTGRAGTLYVDADREAALAAWIATAVGAEHCVITDRRLLTGGAVQENWRLDLRLSGGVGPSERAVVLRTDALHRLPLSIDRTAEFAVVTAAHRAGVKVAEPIARTADTSIIGRPFMVQAFAEGSGQARKIVRDPSLARFGPALARALGGELAKIHALVPEAVATAPAGAGDLSCLPVPLLTPARAMIGQLRSAVDTAGDARPALEYVLVWLEANAPDSRRLVLCHGDFRTGNYLVSDGRLTAILDWEFAHWGDPASDIGWFTSPCWRFGSDLEAGGIASIDALLEGYVAGGGIAPSARDLAYWQIMAAARWAAIALLQAKRFHDGDRTLEAALTGLMPPEMELDALDAIEAFDRHFARSTIKGVN